MGTFDHSSRSAFVRSHTHVGQKGLALSLRSNSSQRCSIGLRSGLSKVQASQVHPHQTLLSMSLWTLLCALVYRVSPRKLAKPSGRLEGQPTGGRHRPATDCGSAL